MDRIINAKCLDLERAICRLELVDAHYALLILRHSLSTPKLLFTIRCSPCSMNAGLDRFDALVRNALERVTNSKLDDKSWIQAGLPVARGGLGIRSVGLLAPSAFLASAASTSNLQARLLPAGFNAPDFYVQSTQAIWLNRYKGTLPDESVAGKQKSWDEACVHKGLTLLSELSADPQFQARFLACQADHSGDWLHAWPISACGLRMDDEAVRVAVGLRLGLDLCSQHPCPCGAAVDASGRHGLSCRRSKGRATRHSQINDTIYRAMTRAGIPAAREPVGLLRDDNKRPDGCSLVPWQHGRCVTWDVTVPDTFAASHLPFTSNEAGLLRPEQRLASD